MRYYDVWFEEPDGYNHKVVYAESVDDVITFITCKGFEIIDVAERE